MIVLEGFIFFVYIYITLITVYLLTFSIAGRFLKRSSSAATKQTLRKTAVLIPAYKEDAIIVSTVTKALQQSYPSIAFEVIVIANTLQESTLLELRALPIKVLEVHFEVGSKARSLNKALSLLPAYQTAVILDADNIMAYDFLEKINLELDKGFVAVQGHRTAKNTNTSVATLDAISEESNNHVLRKGHRALGLSAALIGSAMAFDYAFYCEKMQKIDSTVEDKELELEILKEGIKIQYLEDALVYDEKVQNVNVYKDQRIRWVAVQLECLKKYFLPACRQLIFKGNFDFFNKVFQTTFPPRIVMLGILFMGLVVSLIFEHYPIAILTSIAIFFFIIALLLSVPANLLSKVSFREITKAIILSILVTVTFYKVRNAQKRFANVHTPKNIV